MQDINSNSQEHVAEDSLDQQIEDLEVREDADRVTAGTSDPDEGGQVHGGGVRSRLAANCNETLVEDES